MNAKHIESRFAAMGARLKVREIASRWQMGNRKWIDPVNYAVDIRRDRDGEFLRPDPHDGQRGVPGLNKPSRGVHPSASRFTFPSCSSRAERPPDKRKTAER